MSIKGTSPKKIQQNRRKETRDLQITNCSKNNFKQKNRNDYPKLIFILIILLFFISIATSSYIVYQTHQKKMINKKTFEAKTEELLSDIQKKQRENNLPIKKMIEQKKNIQRIFYSPDTSLNAPHEMIEKALLTTENNAEKKLTDQKALVVAYINRQRLSEKLTKYTASAESYHWNNAKTTFDRDTTVTSSPIYVSENTGQPVALKDIVSDQGSLLGIRQVIQQKILNAADQPETIIDKVLAMPTISYDTAIKYSPDFLKVLLPENNTGLDEITLGYQDIAAFVNPAFVRPEVLANALPELDKNKKYIALTFDDGPNNSTTPQLLDSLKENNVKATFFMLGSMVAQNQAIAKRAHDEGHEIASHTYSHINLPNASPEQIKKEITDTDKIIFSATGCLPRNLRPPYGSINVQTAEIAGMPIIQWDIDSADWASKNSEKIANSVEKNAFDGAIILIHDIHSQSIAAVPSIIHYLKKENYEFVTVDQLLSGKQKPLHQYFGRNDKRLIN